MAAKLQFLLILTTIAPWLIWLDVNAMAVRFFMIKDRWPIGLDPESISNDPIYRFLDPTIGGQPVVFMSIIGALTSIPIWVTLWLTIGRNHPVAVRYWLLGAVTIGWILLFFDPTHALDWYMD